MSGDWRSQLGRLKREMREVAALERARRQGTAALPPGQRAGAMPRTKAARLAELDEIRAAHGLPPGAPLSSLVSVPAGKVDQPTSGPMCVWVMPEGHLVTAQTKPPGARSLIEAGRADGAFRFSDPV